MSCPPTGPGLRRHLGHGSTRRPHRPGHARAGMAYRHPGAGEEELRPPGTEGRPTHREGAPHRAQEGETRRRRGGHDPPSGQERSPWDRRPSGRRGDAVRSPQENPNSASKGQGRLPLLQPIRDAPGYATREITVRLHNSPRRRQGASTGPRTCGQSRRGIRTSGASTRGEATPSPSTGTSRTAFTSRRPTASDTSARRLISLASPSS